MATTTTTPPFPRPRRVLSSVVLILTLTLIYLDNAARAQLGQPNIGQGSSSSNNNNNDDDSACPPQTDCVHGFCPFGSEYCVCHPGFAGFQCEQACPPDCGERGTCQTSSDGAAYCACDDEFRYVTGSGCLADNAAPASATVEDTATLVFPSHVQPDEATAAPNSAEELMPSGLRPLSVRMCVPGFVCLHGQCAPDSIGCVCDEGWSGAFCDEVCSKNCTDHGRCMVHVDGTSYCSCDGYYTGDLCEDSTAAVTAQPSPPASQDGSPSSIADPTTAATTPMSDTSATRSLADRTCVPGFVCVHGRCGQPPKATLTCVCDAGWGGVFCQEPCHLDCGQFGSCRTTSQVTGVGSSGRMYCSCVNGFTGPRCEISRMNDTGPKPETTRTPLQWNVSVVLRPRKERECVAGFLCLHGRCAEDGSIRCTCDPGYVGAFCHKACSLDCSDHGDCEVFSNGTAYCQCESNYTGVNCSAVRQSPEADAGGSVVHWYVVGACGAALLILLVMLVVLPYWMWKRGHIFMMKVVYHFKSFEDDDKKLYDAFISHSHADHNFVATQLFPRLTEMKFKVCVHQKDFIAGETIANNIIQAVDNSRRTLLVLTPDFLRSEFCRFEYQQAQYQMIRQRQRIVPIVLRDVAQEKKHMDPTLRSILDTITYLVYPQDGDAKKLEKFWKRLELSMPKRKDRGQDKSPAAAAAAASNNNASSPPSKPSTSMGSTAAGRRYQSASSASSTSTYCRLDSVSSGYSTESSRAGSFTSSVSLLGAQTRRASSADDQGGRLKSKASRSVSGASSSSTFQNGAVPSTSSAAQSKPGRRASRGSSGGRSSRARRKAGENGSRGSVAAALGEESVYIEMDCPEGGWNAGRGYEGYSNPAFSGM